MDAHRFDTLLRSLTAAATRRDTIRTIALLLLGGSLRPVTDGAVAKKKRKPCGPCRRKKKGTCKQKRPDGTPCGSGKECQNGECLCPEGTESCGGACLEFCCHSTPATRSRAAAVRQTI